MKSWLKEEIEEIGSHRVVALVPHDENALGRGLDWVASEIPNHYVDPSELADILEKLGKPKAALVLSSKLPTSKQIKSGDLGEILGTEYARHFLGYKLVNRLRWKDSRNMAMRGDDLIGIDVDDSNEVQILKGEAKSRNILNPQVIGEADAALRKSGGRPDPQALTFVASRMREMGEVELSLKVLSAELSGNANVVHLLFTFSGNQPAQLLRDHVIDCSSQFPRHAVGLHINEHQSFIHGAYEKLVDDAE